MLQKKSGVNKNAWWSTVAFLFIQRISKKLLSIIILSFLPALLADLQLQLLCESMITHRSVAD
jgi:hypothetical protein